MSAPVLVPNSDLVLQCWLKTIPGIVNVGMTVPDDETSWADDGFVQEMCTGGSPHPDFPLRMPMCTLWCWAVKIGSKKPPWGDAARLANLIFNACYDEQAVRRPLTVVAGGNRNYPAVLIKELNVRSEPRPYPGDPGGRARYTFDLEMNWVQP